MGTFHEDHYTYLIIYLSFLLRIRNVSDEGSRERHNTHFVLNYFCFSEIRVVYEIMWKNTVEPDR